MVGKADTELKIPSEPYAAANRRISFKIEILFKENIDFAKKEGDELKSILQETLSPSN